MSRRTDDREVVLDIEGMTCASCVGKIEKALRAVDGVDDAAVNLATRTATVRSGTGPGRSAPDGDPRTGYGARRHEPVRDPRAEARSYARRLVVAVLCTVPVLALTFLVPDAAGSPEMAWLLTTPVAGVCGVALLLFGRPRRASRGDDDGYAHLARRRRRLRLQRRPRWSPAAMALYFDTAAVIITLILVGKVLEARARVAAGDASRDLEERGAKDATILVDGQERTIPIEELHRGRSSWCGRARRSPPMAW